MAAAEFDYIVVGAGSAGAALAARLGEAADRTTCVIEAGGQDTPSVHPYPELRRRGDRPRGDQLAVQDRAAAGHGRARDPGAARARARRLGLDQRHGLFPRPPDRLRRLGRRRRDRLVLRRSAALLHPHREQRELSRERVPRPRRADQRQARRGAERAQLRVHGRARLAAIPRLPGLQRAEPRRLRPPPGPDARRRARDHRQEHAPPGARARQHPCPDRRAGGAGAGREGPLRPASS